MKTLINLDRNMKRNHIKSTQKLGFPIPKFNIRKIDHSKSTSKRSYGNGFMLHRIDSSRSFTDDTYYMIHAAWNPEHS